MVDAPVVVIVFIVATWSGAIVVLVGHAVVVVVHGVLVSEVEIANRPNVGVGVVDRGVEVAVRGDVAWVKALSLKSIIIDWPFKNTVVVVVPIIDVENTVVVMVVRVGPITSVKSLKQVVNAVVVIVKVVKVVDAIVVVVARSCFFQEGRV